ncbi:MAG: MFS transporter [Streptococcus sp.]|nr:MFS transporter [Streptococcus sp.]
MSNHHQKVSKDTLFAILATALITFAGILSETSMNVTFPKLMTVFHTDIGVIQWITTGYLLAVAITITLGATLAHNWTERKILFVSLIIFILGNTTAMLSSNFPTLMLGRILQGGATGIAIPLLFNLIVERVPRNQIGLYMGLSGLVVSLAPAIGPTYGGAMIQVFDWHMIYTFITPVPIISFILGYFFLKNSEKKMKRLFDWLSFILLSVFLTSAIIAISGLEKGGFNWTPVIIFLLTLGLFIWRCLSSAHPFLDIRILANPIILLGIIPFFIYQFSNLSTNFLIPNFLTTVGGETTSAAGFALLPGTMLGAFLAPLLGKLYDSKGPKLSLFGGNTLFFLAVVIFYFFTKNLSLFPIIFTYIFFTIGRNMAFNNTLALSVSQIDKEKTADATALFQMFQTFAGALGTAIAAVMVKQAPNMETGVHNVFFLLSILVFLIFVLFHLLFSAIKNKKF